MVHVEEEITNNKVKYNCIFYNKIDAYVYIKFKFTKDGNIEKAEILDVNEHFEKIIRRNRSDIIGRNILEDFLDLETQINIKKLLNITESKKVVDFHLYSSRTSKWYLVTANIFRRGFCIAVIKDINNLKVMQVNDGKIKRYKYEKQFDLLAKFSHEIRNPLNAIKGMIDLTLLSKLSKEQKDNLLIANNSLDNLIYMLNNVLDFSKMEAGKMPIIKKEFNIHNLLREITKQEYSRLKNKSVELMYHIDEDIPSILVGDEIRLKQIILNLVGNAIKFTDYGHIIINVTKVKINCNCITIKVSVIDTGIGIKEEDLSLLFKDFSQIITTNSINKKGTGLGLSISKKIINLLGGHIWVESKLGKGSTFSFSISYEYRNNNIKYKRKLKLQDSNFKEEKNINILVAEDNELNQKVLYNILKLKNYNVIQAYDGLQVLSLLDKEYVDIIFMDIDMPNMDGIETTIKIRNMEDRQKRSIPIIAITGYDLKQEKDELFKLGINDYLLKPIIINDLYNKIKKYTRNKYVDEYKLNVDELLNKLENREFNIIHNIIEKSSVCNKNDKLKRLCFKIKFACNRKDYERIKQYLNELKCMKKNKDLKI